MSIHPSEIGIKWVYRMFYQKKVKESSIDNVLPMSSVL